MNEKKILQSTLDDWTYTCGAQLQDLNLQGRLQDIVAVMNLWKSFTIQLKVTRTFVYTVLQQEFVSKEAVLSTMLRVH